MTTDLNTSSDLESSKMEWKDKWPSSCSLGTKQGEAGSSFDHGSLPATRGGAGDEKDIRENFIVLFLSIKN